MTDAPRGTLLKPALGLFELRPQTSLILEELVASFSGPSVTVSDILLVLHRRAYGMLILLVALIALIPGISIVGALLMVYVGVQMMVARPVPHLPGFIVRRSLPTATLARWIGRLLPPLRWLERFIRPRLPLMSAAVGRVVLGIVVVLLGVLLMMPVPFSQLLPGAAAVLLAAGLLERDGLVLMLATLFAAGALLVGYILFMALLRGLGAVL